MIDILGWIADARDRGEFEGQIVKKVQQGNVVLLQIEQRSTGQYQWYAVDLTANDFTLKAVSLA